MTEPSTPQPDDEQPVTDTPAERQDDHADDQELGGDDDLIAGQIGSDETRP